VLIPLFFPRFPPSGGGLKEPAAPELAASAVLVAVEMPEEKSASGDDCAGVTLLLLLAEVVARTTDAGAVDAVVDVFGVVALAGEAVLLLATLVLVAEAVLVALAAEAVVFPGPNVCKESAFPCVAARSVNNADCVAQHLVFSLADSQQ
jgi:hypothetical protein